MVKMMATATLVLGALNTSMAIDRRAMYGRIVDINPFRLQPEPPPTVAAPLDEPEPVVVNVNVTGFSMRNNLKKVYLMIPPTKDSSVPQYLTLQEKDRHGSIEVLEINPELESVKIRNAGKVALLTFESHGMKAAPVANTKTQQASTTTQGRTSNRVTANTGNVPGGPVVIGRGGVRKETAQYLPQNSSNPAMNSGGQGGMNGNRVNANSTQISPRNALGNRRNYVNTAPNNPFQGTGEEVAIQQIIALEAQRQANPNMIIPPVPGMPSTMPQQGGNQGQGGQ